MPKLSQIKGIIFDLDGVLIDSEELHYLAWVKVLKPLGLNFSKKENFNYAGKQIDITAGELLEKYNLNVAKEKLVKQRRKIIIEYLKNSDVKLMPYARWAVKFFVKKNGTKLGLASGSVKEMIILKLKKAGLYSFFTAIVAGDDIKRGKPYPDSYLLAAKKLKLKPEECLAIEDTQYGCESAKSAGLFCFAIPNKYSRKQNFSKTDKVFKDLEKAINYIKSKNLCLI